MTRNILRTTSGSTLNLTGRRFAVFAHYDAYVYNAGAFAQAVSEAGGSVDFLTLNSRGMGISDEQISTVSAQWPILENLPRYRMGIEELRNPSFLAPYDGVFFGAGGEELLVGFRNFQQAFLLLGPRRPLVVTGFPGIVDAGRTAGMLFRCPSDVVLLPAAAQFRLYRMEMSLLGKCTRNALLYGMPSLPPSSTRPASRQMPQRILFIDQSAIPRSAGDREQLVVELSCLLDRLPDSEIWIRERVRVGETSIHELGASTKLSNVVAKLTPQLPALARVKVKQDPLRSLFEQVDAALSVSSTGLLEALMIGLPVASLKRFSRVPEFGNAFFRSSGLQVDIDELINKGWPEVRLRWVENNVLSPKQVSSHDQLTGQQRLVQRLAFLLSYPRKHLPNPVEHGSLSRRLARLKPHVLVQRALQLFT